MKTRIGIVAAVALGSMLLMIGCGGAGGPRPPMGKVKGTVTYNGTPLDTGSVVFSPAQGKSSDTHVATGQLESGGSFMLTTFNTGDGAVLGQHVVTISSRQEGGGGGIPTPGPDGTLRIDYTLPKSRLPSKYESAESSPLRYTVEPGDNFFEIELED